MSVTGWDGVTLTVEVALSADTSTYGLWDSGIWDESTWGPDVVWTDVSGYVRRISTDRAFSRGVQAWQGGTATVELDNRDGRFSPANIAGPYVTSGVTQVRPLRPIRVYATYASVTYHLYRGYVLEWREAWSVNAAGSGDAISVLNCADEFNRLAAVDGVEVTPVGAGETTGARVHRVLNAAGHTGDRTIDVGEATVQATTLAQNALAELEDVVAAEAGALYVDVDGAVRFDGKDALIENAASLTSQATFGDTGTDLRYTDAEVAYDSDLVINYAVYTREGGTAQTVTDATSRALYGDRRDAPTGLICELDSQALALAQWKVLQYKDPEYRFTSITIKPRRTPATLFPQALGRAVRDMITVKRNPVGGYEISRACHIAGIAHDITPDDWTTIFALWSATAYVQFAASRWDEGLWDEALWFF